MTANVTSLAKVRAAARERAERLRTNNRMSTVLLVVSIVLLVIGLGPPSRRRRRSPSIAAPIASTTSRDS
jgi:hypothetical protein